MQKEKRYPYPCRTEIDQNKKILWVYEEKGNYSSSINIFDHIEEIGKSSITMKTSASLSQYKIIVYSAIYIPEKDDLKMDGRIDIVSLNDDGTLADICYVYEMGKKDEPGCEKLWHGCKKPSREDIVKRALGGCQ